MRNFLKIRILRGAYYYYKDCLIYEAYKEKIMMMFYLKNIIHK